MTMLATARLMLHPGRRFHDGHPPKRRALVPVCLFGVCDAVDAERVYRREMDKERRRLTETYELSGERTPSTTSRVPGEDERNPLTEVVADANRRETTPAAMAEGGDRIERTPSTAGGVVRDGRVTKRRQIKLTDLWTKTKPRNQTGVVGDVKPRPSGSKLQASTTATSSLC